MAKKNISVKFGRLTEQLISKNVEAGTNIVEFCKECEVEYSSDIRVNGETENREYVLKAGDIVTAITDVNGGR
jgi:hypothetical protein